MRQCEVPVTPEEDGQPLGLLQQETIPVNAIQTEQNALVSGESNPELHTLVLWDNRIVVP